MVRSILGYTNELRQIIQAQQLLVDMPDEFCKLLKELKIYKDNIIENLRILENGY